MVQETDRLTFNQFQKELTNRGIDRQVAYMFTMLYERQIEIAKQMDMCAEVVTQLANTVTNFTELHARTQQGLDRLMKEMRGDGSVDVRSVANDPNDMN